MKVQEFIDLIPKKIDDADKFCIVFFSREEDKVWNSFDLDSGDALIVIQALIDKYGIQPAVLASMQEPDIGFETVLGDMRIVLGNPRSD